MKEHKNNVFALLLILITESLEAGILTPIYPGSRYPGETSASPCTLAGMLQKMRQQPD